MSMNIRKAVCLINRTDVPLIVTFDGQQFVMVPGENYVDPILVRFAKAQHPIPGSQDPNNPERTKWTDTLFAVKGTKDDASEISQEMIDMLPKEAIDRTLLANDRQNVVERQTRFPRGRIGVDDPSTGMVDGSAAMGGRD